MNRKLLFASRVLLLAALTVTASRAQIVVKEDFSGATTTNSWYFFNGACLTAGGNSTSTSPGSPPGCGTVLTNYYRLQNSSDTHENLVGGQTGSMPDAVGSGALRFTDGYPGGYNQNGAIIGATTFPSGSGLVVTFKTYTYLGDKGGPGKDGADGMSFFLMDGSVTPNLGAYGGSLGYTCSNQNPPYNGMIGAYLGLGIDEYGNFLNGATSKGTNDNTASGLGLNTQNPQEIGMRGAGSISWSALTGAGYVNGSNKNLYPASLSSALQQQAVQNTCQTGKLWDYSNGTSGVKTSTAVADYPMIPNGNVTLSGVQIANESATKRSQANSLTYRLRITPDGLLSLYYALNAGSWQPVLKGQSITASNGALPATLRFGFAGSSGGSTNIHEIACFQASPADTSGSSTTANDKQSGKVENGTQAYFAYYDPIEWTGGLTANTLVDNAGVVTVATTANWDASCVLTGVASGGTCGKTGVAGPTAAQGWIAGSPSSGRTILSWNPSSGTGVPFQWANLSAAEQTALNSTASNPDSGGATGNGSLRVNYLRGQRASEVNSSGVGLFRPRYSVLGDIVDSSPLWVGPPSSPYTAGWLDRLYPAATAPENAGQSYLSFSAAQQSRENVVYVGANDGMLHGFRTGSFTASGTYVNNSTTPNDGAEVLAYVPAAVLSTIETTNTQAGCGSLDYSNTQYCHAYYVDAPPGSGDLYYNSQWHTWLAGGLGAGGAAIYALDITNDSSFSETPAAAASTVIGEWTPSTISCVGNASCGNNLGNTYGTPIIRRLHDGKWALIFGNGFGSSTGDAGIFVITISATGTMSPYYLSTGSGGGNGIASVTAADLDGDHITDYVYAGDLKGNVWRFDLTSQTEASWAAGAAPLFTTSAGQPITSQLVVASVAGAASSLPRLIIAFGTGQATPITALAPAGYASGTQSLYGVWDWNLGGWNALSTAQYASLAAAATGLASPYTITPTSATLAAQTPTVATSSGVSTVDESATATVCWKGSTACGGGAASNTNFGWSLALPNASEQIIYNPQLVGSVFTVNSVIPASTATNTCSSTTNDGYTYGISIASGGLVPSFFQNYSWDTKVIAIENRATGSSYVVTTAEGGTWLIYQTSADKPSTTQVNPPPNTTINRLTWTELR